jgi:hypothetical protein
MTEWSNAVPSWETKDEWPYWAVGRRMRRAMAQYRHLIESLSASSYQISEPYNYVPLGRIK